MRHPKHVTIDGKAHSGPVAMHTCPTTGEATPIYRDDADPIGRMGHTACISCDYRRTPEGNERMIATNRRAVLAAFGIH